MADCWHVRVIKRMKDGMLECLHVCVCVCVWGGGCIREKLVLLNGHGVF